MTTRNQRKRKDDRPVRTRDLPIHRHNGFDTEHDHRRKAGKRHRKHKPEAFEDPGHLDEKVGSLHFLLRCAPRDVVGEQVCENGNAQVDAQTPKEEEASSSKRVSAKKKHGEKRSEDTDKNSIHLAVSMVESIRLQCPSRYSSMM